MPRFFTKSNFKVGWKGKSYAVKTSVAFKAEIFQKNI